MFNDFTNLTTRQLIDKKYSLEALFEVLKIVGIIFLSLMLVAFCIAMPAVGIPLTLFVIGSVITFAFLRLRAINQELKKR